MHQPHLHEQKSGRLFKWWFQQLSPSMKHRSSSTPILNVDKSKSKSQLPVGVADADSIPTVPHRSAISRQTKSFTRTASGEGKRNSRLALFFKRSKREEFEGPTRSRSLDCIVVNASRAHALDDPDNSLGEEVSETDTYEDHHELPIVSPKSLESLQGSVFEEESMASQDTQEGTPHRKQALVRRSSSFGSRMELLYQQQMEANTSKSKTLSVGPRRTSRTSTQQTLLVPLSSQMISKSMENLISEEETSRKSTKTVSKPSLEEVLLQLSSKSSPDLQSQLKIAGQEMPPSWMDVVANCETLSQGHHELQSAIWELLSNELGNIRILRIVHYFYSTLLHLQSVQHLTDVDAGRLFGNIKNVLDACEEFWYKRLRQVYLNSRESGNLLNALDVNRAFETFPHNFGPYVTYCTRDYISIDYLRELKNNQKFNTFLQWCHGHPECERQQLLGLLSRPMQQITRYQLLLERVQSKEQSPMIKTLLCDRIAEVKDFVMLVNDTARLKHETKVLRDLSSRISGFVLFDNLPSEAQFYLSTRDKLDLLMHMKDMPHSVCQQRVQIHQGPCGLMKSPTKEVRGFMYLLTDLLLVTVKSGNRKQKLLKQPMYLHRLQIGLGGNSSCFLLMYYGDFGLEYIVDAVWVNTDSSESAREWQKQITDAQINYQRLKNGEEVKSHPRIPRMHRQSIARSETESMASPSRDDHETDESGTGPSHGVANICRNISTTSSPFSSSHSSGVEYRAKKVSLASSLRSSRPVSEISTCSRLSLSSDTWSRFDSSSDEEMSVNGKTSSFQKEFVGSSVHNHSLAINGVPLDIHPKRVSSDGCCPTRKSLPNGNGMPSANLMNDDSTGESFYTDGQSMQTLSPLIGKKFTKERSRSCFELDVSSECV